MRLLLITLLIMSPSLKASDSVMDSTLETRLSVQCGFVHNYNLKDYYLKLMPNGSKVKDIPADIRDINYNVGMKALNNCQTSKELMSGVETLCYDSCYKTKEDIRSLCNTSCENYLAQIKLIVNVADEMAKMMYKDLDAKKSSSPDCSDVTASSAKKSKNSINSLDSDVDAVKSNVSK